MMSGPASAAGGAAVIGEVVEAGGANVMLGKPDAVELTSGEARTLCEGAMSFSPQTPQAGEPVIIDTDPGIDDALALVFAAASSMRIEGVTIVHGINANICLRLAGAPSGVMVYLGDGKPVAEVEITEASHAGVDVHGPDALGEARPATVESDLQFGALSAKDFLYQRCAALPGQVTLVALGPLTNVAACLRDHPDLPRLVKRIVIMGGAVLEQRGNRTPSSEANFADDPTAAHEVLTAGFADLVLAPLDVTHQIDLVALRTSLGESKGELAGFLHDISRFYIAAYFKLGHAHVPVHDPVPIAYLLQPTLFKWRDVRVDVETEGRITSGMSVADWNGKSRRPANARVLLDVDESAFHSFFLSKIADKDAEHAVHPNKRPRIVDPPPIPPPGNRQGPPGNGTLEIARVRQTSNHAHSQPPPHPRVGVGVLLLQKGRPGYVLVGRRKGSHGSGLCQLPGGHLEMCESWEQCAVRELEEETGITIKEPKLMEPDKCEGWSWEPWDKLPGNLFHPLEKFSKSMFILPSPDVLLDPLCSYPAASFSVDCAHVLLKGQL